MHARHLQRFLTAVFLSTLCLVSARAQAPASPAQPDLTEDQMKDFLLRAKVVASRHTSTGTTSPWRLTLSDGTITHDALFQSIDDRKTSTQLADGTTQLNFVDSYRYNIAGYEIGRLLAIGHMIPVTVQRNWNQMTGSLSWWVTVKMDERTRQTQKIAPPDPDAWNKQLNHLNIFAQLIFDTDANQTNYLITEDWKLWRVDFSRAFRLNKTLPNDKALAACSRDFLAKLRALNRSDVEAKTKGQLTKSEIDALMARRDRIVSYFDRLVAEKGEAAVLF